MVYFEIFFLSQAKYNINVLILFLVKFFENLRWIYNFTVEIREIKERKLENDFLTVLFY